MAGPRENLPRTTSRAVDSGISAVPHMLEKVPDLTLPSRDTLPPSRALLPAKSRRGPTRKNFCLSVPEDSSDGNSLVSPPPAPLPPKNSGESSEQKTALLTERESDLGQLGESVQTLQLLLIELRRDPETCGKDFLDKQQKKILIMRETFESELFLLAAEIAAARTALAEVPKQVNPK